MKSFRNITYALFILLLACSSSSEKSENEGDTSKKSDFTGHLELTINGELFEYDEMTRTDSRLSFQEKAIAVYIANSNGEGTIAQITILSPKIYNSTTHSYVKESGRWLEEGDTSEPPSRREQNLNFKFRRIDKMDEEEYIELDRGSVDLKYDDDDAIFELTFTGKDMPSSYNTEETEEIQFSGRLVLKGAYLMDSRD